MRKAEAQKLLELANRWENLAARANTQAHGEVKGSPEYSEYATEAKAFQQCADELKRVKL